MTRIFDPSFLRLADATSDFVVVLDERRTILHANAAACALTGHAAGDLDGEPWQRLCGRRTVKAYGAIIDGVLRSGTAWSGEMELQGPRRAALPLAVTIEPLPGPIHRVVVVAHEVRPDRGRKAAATPANDDLNCLCDSLEDGVAVCDTKGTIAMCNAAFARMVGLPQREIVGTALPYPWTEAADTQSLRDAFRVFARERALSNQVVTFRRRNGTKIVASLSFSELRSGKRAPGRVVVTARDVTDVQFAQDVRRAADQVYRLRLDVQRKAQRLETLQEVNATVLKSSDTEAIFHQIVDGINRLVGHDLAGIYLFDAARGLFFAHTLSKRTPFSRKLAKFPLAMGEGIIGEAAATGKMVLANNAQFDPRSAYPPGMRPEKEHFIAVPLRGRLSIFGILVVARNRDPEFIEEEAEIVRSFADAATVALENAQLHQERRTADEPARPAPSRRTS